MRSKNHHNLLTTIRQMEIVKGIEFLPQTLEPYFVDLTYYKLENLRLWQKLDSFNRTIIVRLCGITAHQVLILGTSDLFDLGTSDLFDLGTSNLFDLGTSNLFDLDTSDLSDLGTSDLSDLGTSNLFDYIFEI